jgi:hypothetical protein
MFCRFFGENVFKIITSVIGVTGVHVEALKEITYCSRIGLKLQSKTEIKTNFSF